MVTIKVFLSPSDIVLPKSSDLVGDSLPLYLSVSLCSSVSWWIGSKCSSNWRRAEGVTVQAPRRRVGLTHTWWRVWTHHQGHQPALHFGCDIISKHADCFLVKIQSGNTHTAWYCFNRGSVFSSRCGYTVRIACGPAGISNILHCGRLRHRSEHHTTETGESILQVSWCTRIQTWSIVHKCLFFKCTYIILANDLFSGECRHWCGRYVTSNTTLKLLMNRARSLSGLPSSCLTSCCNLSSKSNMSQKLNIA